ncbi:IS66 family insertion sequence element accessory protein TnpB [Paenibacillus sp. CGMCC 1.16610]|uniref:IS66 family insertion sequence element accessory protein TnpB n=1 Tax=Paenibacillus anseongense TaxID=2682845 RepID=A0ABW9UB41_9BACL|nr:MULTISPECIES: IS66 family insertion sequence element accessory protein TnpB [Paenibacillus]MBA2937169.1 IS66 family insertion sequence element accessory protein TnpB [Paenibacillus sp. CGMCC 1.16610]MVQ36231.1 IS66 family insertion sequence element accessory protein TnpB [Paenibacillus anseongense]
MDTNLQVLWKERINAYQASGKSMKAWCADQNLTLHQLKYWLYKDQRRARAASSATFRPVTVTSSYETDAVESLRIQVGVAWIEVPSGFKPELLRDVIAALTPLC